MEFGSAERLIASLEVSPKSEWLMRGREADDLAALKTLVDCLKSPSARRPRATCARTSAAIPDFRAISAQEHATPMARIFDFLQGAGRVPTDWLAQQVARIDRTDGEIDNLSKRLAFIRTWTYVAQRKAGSMTKSLARRNPRCRRPPVGCASCETDAKICGPADKRVSPAAQTKESLVADVNDKGEVTVEGEFVGRLEGFRFQQDASASADEGRTLRQAAYEALKPEFHLRADRFYNAPDTEMDFTDQGGLMG